LKELAKKKRRYWSARHAFRFLREKHPQTLHASRAGERQIKNEEKGTVPFFN